MHKKRVKGFKFKYDQKQNLYPMNVSTFIRAIMAKISEKGKRYEDFFIHISLIFLSLRGRYNFLNMSRYGDKAESTYRTRFKKEHNIEEFNLELIKTCLSKEVFWAFDPSYLSKSGKESHGVGKFWSGCSGAMKWGQEISCIAAVGVKERTALHYKAVQTPSKMDEKKLLEHYAEVLISEKASLQLISNIVVADAFFSKKSFVDELSEHNLILISRFRSDVRLQYLYVGPQKGFKGKNIGGGKGSGGGAPRKYDGRVNLKNLNPQYFIPCYQDENEIGYEAVVYCIAMKRVVRVVVVHKLKADGTIKSVQVFFSTNPSIIGMDILLYYRLRFQQEFIFRDAKQYVGLQDCQARSEEQIDFHVNMSMTTVNIAKAVHHLNQDNHDIPFSMADIKTHYFNQLMIQKTLDVFIDVSGIHPNLIINNPKILQLINLGKIAA